MSKPIISSFNQIAPLIIQQYERYLPTAFDESMSLVEKVNKVIQKLNEMGLLVNDVVAKWNEVMEWVMSEGLTEAVHDKLDNMIADGTLEQIFAGKISLILEETVIVKVPSDYPTLQEAIDSLSGRKPLQGKRINIQMETGFQPSLGIKVENGDYKHFIITSIDGVVNVAPNYTGNFIEANNANAPTLACLIDANRIGGAGVWLDNQSTGTILAGCGVKNCYNRSLYVNKGSKVWAEGSIWTGGRIQGLWISRVSEAFVDYALFDSCGSESVEVGGEPLSIHISRQSRVYGLRINARNSGGTAVKVQRGSLLSAPEADFSNAKDNGVQVTGGSVAYIEQALIQNTGKIGLINQGSMVSAYLADVSGKVGNTSNGVVCEMAGNLDFDRSRVSNFGGMNLMANRAGIINASSSEVLNAGNNGVYAEQGSNINIRSAKVTGSTNKDIVIGRGASVNAFDCTTSNGVGSPSLGDTNVSKFNVFNTNIGVIWSGAYVQSVLEKNLLLSTTSNYLNLTNSNDLIGIRISPYGHFWVKPANDGDVLLEADTYIRKDGNQFRIQTATNGSTLNRPVDAQIGQLYFDVDLGKPIWLKSTGVWIDAAGDVV